MMRLSWGGPTSCRSGVSRSHVIFVDDPEHDEDRGDAGGRDAEAQEALLDAGWTVIQVRHTDRFETVVGKYPSVFGPRKQEGPR
jgi:hypothetical protein